MLESTTQVTLCNEKMLAGILVGEKWICDQYRYSEDANAVGLSIPLQRFCPSQMYNNGISGNCDIASPQVSDGVEGSSKSGSNVRNVQET
jgi:hypothetical protein